MNYHNYEQQVYAGVLGKIIGVFYGRPIEGWPYEKIRKTFDVVDHYVYKEAGTPLIVADDDVAGTFTFFNAVEDCADIRKLTANDFGEAWLDYIIENKTIFWWGGLGRSTEHTAYLRLQQGIKAPVSGSVEMNGEAVAEQIGAQIFMDALAMMCPGDPELAKYLVKQSASVSHDGIAVESACFLAAIEAMAFEEKDIYKLLECAARLGTSKRMKKIIDDILGICVQNKDWREVRDWLDIHYGYQLYPGNCHVIPNLALILTSLVLGGDHFSNAMNICVSSGWDTDCNGANLGCINGIRLGLDAITRDFDYRTPLAERMYNISAEGGNCVSDAVIQTRRIIKQKQRLYGEVQETRRARFSFELPGSVQGFTECPIVGKEDNAIINANIIGKVNGIYIEVKGKETSKAVSTPVMWDLKDKQANYCLTGSPVLYESQEITAMIMLLEGKATARLYALYYDFNNEIKATFGEWNKLQEEQVIKWKIPSLNGACIARIGIEIKKNDGGSKTSAILRSLDWKGAPEKFAVNGSLRNYDINGFNMQMESFVSSARHYSFDARASFTVSHPIENGLVTTGTSDWEDYSVSSVLDASIHRRFGLVGRSRGHRRYYAAVLSENGKAGIIIKKGSEERYLASCDYSYSNNQQQKIKFNMKGNLLTMSIDDKVILKAKDSEYKNGGAGFLIDAGTILAYGFEVRAL